MAGGETSPDKFRQTQKEKFEENTFLVTCAICSPGILVGFGLNALKKNPDP